MDEWKILKIITGPKCVDVSRPMQTAADWKPSKASLARSQALVRKAQQLGAEIDARIKRMQAIVVTQRAEFDRREKERLALRSEQAQREAAEFLERLKQKQQHEQEQSRRSRAYKKAYNRKKKEMHEK